MAQEYPTLNGTAPSWADIAIKFPVYGGELAVTSDIAAIDCSDSVEFGVVRGTSGGRKMKRTTGQEDNDCTVTFYRDGWKVLAKALMAKAPTRNGQVRIGLVGFDILIQHTPPGEAGIYTVKVSGCRIGGRSFSFAEGTDADKVEVPVNPMQIVEIVDGKEVVLI